MFDFADFKPKKYPATSRRMFINMIGNRLTPRLQTTGTMFRCENGNVHLLFENSRVVFDINGEGYTCIAHPLLIVTAATLLSLYEYLAINNNPTVEHLEYEVMVDAAMYTDHIHKLLKGIADEYDELWYRGSEQLYLINDFGYHLEEPLDEVKVACMPYDFVHYNRNSTEEEDDLTTDRLEIICTKHAKGQPSFSPFTVDSNDPNAWNNFEAVKETLLNLILKSEYFSGKNVLYLAIALVHPELNDDEKWDLATKVAIDCFGGEENYPTIWA